MTATHSPDSSTSRRRHQWSVVDIVVAALIAVAGGVIFWAWSAGAIGISAATAAYPPLFGLYGGGWVIPAVLGALIIRKPGAAFFCEMVAATGELIMGSQYGLTVLWSGVVQGLGAEAVFLAFGYRRFTLPVALLAGAGAGLAMGLNDTLLGWYVEYTVDHKIVYTICTVISGAVIAGLLSWAGTRGLARTGVLSPFASRKAASEPIF